MFGNKKISLIYCSILTESSTLFSPFAPAATGGGGERSQRGHTASAQLRHIFDHFPNEKHTRQPAVVFGTGRINVLGTQHSYGQCFMVGMLCT